MCSHIVLPYPNYHVMISAKASKAIKELPKQDQLAIIEKIDALTTQDSLSLDIKKLHGYNHLSRLKSGHYRIIFNVDDEQKLIFIIIIGHREEIYNLVKKLSHLYTN